MQDNLSKIYDINTSQTQIHKSLEKTISSHLKNKYQRPIPELQKNIFNKINSILSNNIKPIILDSGCGTAMSTQVLAKKFPDHWIIGIDRSITRLKKSEIYKDKNTEVINQYIFINNNQILVQADLFDFWELIYNKINNKINNNWQIQKHYLLYPNPYPKAKHFKKRFHGHPVFPILLKLSEQIILRTNWDIYIQEFELAAKICSRDITKINIIKNNIIKNNNYFSLFEKKYVENNIKITELIIKTPQSHLK